MNDLLQVENLQIYTLATVEVATVEVAMPVVPAGVALAAVMGVCAVVAMLWWLQQLWRYCC